MKNLARLLFLIITALWGSYYAVSKEALGRIDPVLFTFFESVSLAPIAFALIVIHRSKLNSSVFRRGVLLGSWLCLAMLTVSVAEKFTTATNTAFFPSIGGVFAACITGLVLRRPLKKVVWVSSGVSLLGMLVIVAISGGGFALRGDLIALLGALFFTTYIFLVGHDRQQEHDPAQGEHCFWLVLGVEHLTIVFWMALIALLFGDWPHLHPTFPKDLEVIIYVGIACTFLPVVVANSMQRYVEPLEASFISILEPVWGVAIAHVYLGESVSLPLYIGGGLILAGALLHISWTPVMSLAQANGRRIRSTLARAFVRKRYGRNKPGQEVFARGQLHDAR